LAIKENKNLYQELQNYICYFNNISLILNILINDKENLEIDKKEFEENIKKLFNFFRFRNFIFNYEQNRLLDIYYYFNIMLLTNLIYKNIHTNFNLLDNFSDEIFNSLLFLYKKIENNFNSYFCKIKNYKQLHIIFVWIFFNIKKIVNKLIEERKIEKNILKDIDSIYKKRLIELIPYILLNLYGWAYNYGLLKDFLIENNKMYLTMKIKNI